MPWQIIPIEATVPIQIDSKGYNVITYIKIGEIASLEKKITILLCKKPSLREDTSFFSKMTIKFGG